MSTPTDTQLPPADVVTPEEERFRFGWRYVWAKGQNGLMAQVRVPLNSEDVRHPQEDDFIANTPTHSRDCRYLEHALRQAIQGREGVEVLREARVDWGVEKGLVHGPDLAVIAEVRQPWRIDVGTFRLKDHGGRPMLVIEVTSPSTRSGDLDDKVVEYHKAGVPFYAIVDYRPECDERQVHIIAYRATSEGYVRIAPDEQGRIWLEPVRLWLASAGDRAVCFNERNEQIADAEEAIARAEAEVTDARREMADMAKRLADMEAELRKLRGSTETPG